MDDQQSGKNYLHRLVTLFMSLVTLADNASHRSAKIRFIVLCILRPCALYARLWLRREMAFHGLEMPDLPPLPRGFGPAAARRLAAQFCAIAQILEVLARTASQPQDYSDGW
ncbi:hypothetical protein BO068_005010, partial [Escherichia coli]|nr:hypothetical protein [Escherichia coli]